MGLWLIIFIQDIVIAIELSLIAIILCLLTGIIIYRKIFEAHIRKQLNNLEYLTLFLVYSIYLTWITAASTLNLCICFYKWGIHEGTGNFIFLQFFVHLNFFLQFTEHMIWTEQGWGMVVLAIIFLVYACEVFYYSNPVIGATAMWIFIAIGVN